MQIHASTNSERCSEDFSPPVFSLFAAFDSRDASEAAAAASELVLSELGQDVSVERHVWDASLLRAPEHRSRAAAEAAGADVLIIALTDDRLAGDFKAWTDEWHRLRQQEGGLLAVIPSADSPESQACVEYLREAALSANMDFLCRTEQHRRRF